MTTDGIEVYEGDGVITTPPSILPGSFATSPSLAAIKAMAGMDPMHPHTTPQGRRVKYPFREPRPGQLEGVDTIQDILKTGSYALFCAGTGFGKSPVLIGTASLYEKAWMIVGRNDLVEQWRKDYSHFKDMGFMKARHLFACVTARELDKDGKPYTCKSGKMPCSKAHDWAGKMIAYGNDIDTTLPHGIALDAIPDEVKLEPQAAAVLRSNIIGDNYIKASTVRQVAFAWLQQYTCPYAANRDSALDAKFTVMTASMALTMFTYMEQRMEKRPLLVVDECSELENELIKFYEVTKRSKWINHVIGAKATVESLCDGAEDVLAKTYGAKTFLKDVIRASKPGGTVPEVVAWCDIVADLLNRKLRRLSDDATDERDEINDALGKFVISKSGIGMGVPYHVAITADGDMGDFEVKLSPLEARGLFDRTLGKFADHCIFTSATTGTAQLFRDTHALKTPVTFAEGGTPFPAANRPILFQPVGNLSKKSYDSDITKVCDAAVTIATRSNTGTPHYEHYKQKGLIHTFNNKVTDAVIAAFSRAGQAHRVVLLRGSGPERSATFNRFKESASPLILVSPSAMLGISLDDDLGRWQIVMKTPYAFLGDAAVVHRKDNIAGWYNWQTTKDLIQSFGRIVRSPTDWGLTYVVDSSFGTHLRYNRDQFPRYILEALHEIP